MTVDKRVQDPQIALSEGDTSAGHVEALDGVTAPVPDIREKHADQPMEELEPTVVGQLVVMPATVPTQRQRLVWARTLLRSPKARIGAAIVLIFILAAFLAPIIAPGDPSQFVGVIDKVPSASHWLGTDTQGRDVFRDTVWGARGSLAVGFGTAALVTIVASIVGVVAAYFGGRVDDILSMIMNIFLVIPGLPLLIVISVYLSPSTTTVIFALAFTGWAWGARIIRSQALSMREREFVSASVVGGEGDLYIMFREILPNLVNIIVGLFIGAAIYGILAQTALAYLGLTNTSEVDWGTNLYWAQNGGALLQGVWWAFIPSGLCVAIVAFGLSLVNYGMDEITNPRLRAERELRNVVKGAALRGVRATPVVRRAG